MQRRSSSFVSSSRMSASTPSMPARSAAAGIWSRWRCSIFTWPFGRDWARIVRSRSCGGRSKCGLRISECGVGDKFFHSTIRTPHSGLVICSRHVRLDSADVHVGADEEGFAVVAEFAVGGALAGVEAAEDFAFGREAIDAAGASGPEVALLIDGHAIGQAGPAFFGPLGAVEQDAACTERAVGVDGKGLPDGGV